MCGIFAPWLIYAWIKKKILYLFLLYYITVSPMSQYCNESEHFAFKLKTV